jgi:hypothetical protein
LKNFAEKIRSLISPRKGIEPDATPFEFIKSKKAMLKELAISKELKNIVGVYSDVLGEGMFLTAVDDIERHNGEEIIVFYQYDVTGKLLIRTSIELSEIQMVCPFNKTYKNPVLFDQRIGTITRNEYKSVTPFVK